MVYTTPAPTTTPTAPTTPTTTARNIPYIIEIISKYKNVYKNESDLWNSQSRP